MSGECKRFFVHTSIFWGLWNKTYSFKTLFAAQVYAKSLKEEWKVTDADDNLIEHSFNYFNKNKN